MLIILKISHVEVKVVDEFIGQMEMEFANEAPLSITRGKIHNYLGMKLDFSNPGKVAIHMEDYVRIILRDIPKDMVGNAVTPAAKHLFAINDVNPIMLDEEQTTEYVHLVMQLSYLSQRG